VLPLAATVLAAAALTSGSAAPGGPAGGPAPTRPYYPALPHQVRLNETPVYAPPVRDGLLQFTVIGYEGGLAEIIGSHAEWFAKGQYVRIRLVLENLDRSQQGFAARYQLLLTADGRSFHPDDFAIAVKRQIWTQLVGASVRIEFDLYFDIPKDARPTAIRFFADPPGAGGQVALPGGR